MGKLSTKLIVLIIIMAFLIIIYIRNVAKMKAISNLCKKIENDPRIAEEISDQLTDTLIEFGCDYKHIYDKLSRLKFEYEVYYHRIYKCYQLKPDSFLLITTYEHLNTSNSDSVEKIMKFNYRIQLEKTNRVKVFCDNVYDEKFSNVKRVFIKGFCKKYLNTDIEINVAIN